MSAYTTALLESPKDEIVTEAVRQKERAEAAEAQLLDYEDDFHSTMAEECDDGDDRKHCACVPHLRRGLKAAEAKLAELTELCSNWVCCAREQLGADCWELKIGSDAWCPVCYGHALGNPGGRPAIALRAETGEDNKRRVAQ